jgi:hypothetical protein
MQAEFERGIEALHGGYAPFALARAGRTPI